MNGPTTEPKTKIIKPINSKTTMIGVSHHFLLCLRKSTNSAISPVETPAACCSKSFGCGFVAGSCGLSAMMRLRSDVRLKLLKVSLRVRLFGWPGDPVRRGRPVECFVHRIAAECSQDQADGRDDPKEN